MQGFMLSNVWIVIKIRASNETSLNLQKQIYEHKRDFIKGNVNNMVRHNLETNNNFKNSKMLVYIHGKKKKKRRKMAETSTISNYNTIELRHSFFNISLSSQIAAKKLHNSLFEIFWFHRFHIYIYIYMCVCVCVCVCVFCFIQKIEN